MPKDIPNSFPEENLLYPVRRRIDQSSIDMVFNYADELRASVERISQKTPAGIVIIQKSPLVTATIKDHQLTIQRLAGDSSTDWRFTAEVNISEEGENAITLRDIGKTQTLTARNIQEFASNGNSELTATMIRTFIHAHATTAVM